TSKLSNRASSMNLQLWDTCTRPDPMLQLVWNTSERKHRLFASACCRRIVHLMADPRCSHAVEVAEQFADAQASARELELASQGPSAIGHEELALASKEGRWNEKDQPPPYTASAAAYNVAIPMGWWGGAPAFVAPYEIPRALNPELAAEESAQADL